MCERCPPFVSTYAAAARTHTQGQTLEPSLLDLTAPYFAHGSWYVAPSRTRSADTTGAYVDARSCVEGDDGRIVPIICLVTHQELLSR